MEITAALLTALLVSLAAASPHEGKTLVARKKPIWAEADSDMYCYTPEAEDGDGGPEQFKIEDFCQGIFLEMNRVSMLDNPFSRRRT